jgi:Tfp pilus assembly PilM family ATPase
MKAHVETLPLGIDIGRRRVRVALLEREPHAAPKLIAVATRDHAGSPVEAAAQAIGELQTRERRCVLALGRPDAVLCTADFPAMSHRERVNAARFEAARFIDYPIAEAGVSVVRTRAEHRWAIGIVRRSALAAMLNLTKRLKLRLALRRAHPQADGVIDVGDDATSLTLFGDGIPYVARIPIGGQRFTLAIAQSLGIDVAAAEERKRRVGFGGAGEVERDVLIAALGEAFDQARASGHAEFRTIVLCGNGSRIPGFPDAIERATGLAVAPSTLSPDVSDTLPPDVLRAAAADWSIAFGLGLWSIAS